MSNEGDGFLRFQARIDAITDAIGEPKLRPAIAKQFAAALEHEMRTARNLPMWGVLPFGVWWTMATTAEFNFATRRAETVLSAPRSALSMPTTAESTWLGTRLRLRDTRVYAEGGGYRLTAAFCFEGSPRFNRRTGLNEPQWQISVSDDVVEAATGRYSGNRPKSTHAKSRDAAVKALRRIVKDFYGVDLK